MSTILISFLPLPPQNPLMPPPCQFHDLFFFNYGVQLVLLVCAWVLGWVLGLGSLGWRAVPGEDWLAPSQRRQLPVILYPGLRHCDISCIHVGLSTGAVILQVLFIWPQYWDFVSTASQSCKRYDLQEDRYLGPLAITIFSPNSCDPPWSSLSLQCRGCLVDVSVGVGHLVSSCSLRFDSCGSL